jgi:hypothetical protein
VVTRVKKLSNEDQIKILELQKEKLRLEQEEKKNNLPHLYGFPWYPWARAHFESTNHINILCAGNQISKSSTQIRKAIDWATAGQERWHDLWPDNPTPRQFWYLYPSKDVSTAEFETKWEPEFMPRGSMKDDKQYGWEVFYKAGYVHHIKFKSGVRIYFKHYSQDVHKLQSGTVHAIFTDEELPVDLFDELSFRVDAVNGYFGMVFTATIGQAHWYKAIERVGQKDEVLKDAFKQQVSRWDCLTYEPQSAHIPTPWTPDKIKRAEAKCSTENERLKRIEGKFVMDEGLKYAAFQRSKNFVMPYFDKIKKEKWYIYSGTDIGSGGKTGHPAAIAFIAVRQDFQKGAVFKGWKSPKNQDVTSPDILAKYQQLRGNMKTICAYYDWAASDFKVHANRLGESFEKAEKGHDIGEDTLNSLFKHQMLDIFDIEELEDLPWEFETLLKETPKRKAKDDFIDAVRYGVTKIPWDWTAVGEEFKEYVAPKKELDPDAQEIENRRTMHYGKQEDIDTIDDEIDYYNDLYEGY